MKQDRFHFCLDQLKRFDHDRYLAALLTPEAVRAPLVAYFAFDAEMMRIPTTVSEPMLADIRFQWWRETLETMTPLSNPGHEIAAALAETLFGHGLVPTDLVSLINLRARDLAEQPFATVQELVDFQRQVAVRQLEFCSCITGETPNKETSTIATTHLTVFGLINQLRRIPHDAASSQLSLPLDLMGRHDIDPHALFQGASSLGLQLALEEILKHADNLMSEAGDLDLRSNAGLVPAMLPTILRSLYAGKLRSPGFDLFHHSSDVPAFRRQLRYLRVRWSKQYQA